MHGQVYIVVPGALVTGGSEALHQLCHAINSSQSGRASIIYRPFKSDWQVPKSFRRYAVNVAEARSSVAGATVVLPETSADLIEVFSAAAEIHFWWLSIDRFFKISGNEADRYLAAAVPRASRHLYQSEHAREFLEWAGFGPIAHLGDYLADEYRRAAARPPAGSRRDLLAYNPVKGGERTAAILAALDGSGIEVVPLSGMTRNQIQQVLKRAKVYIDFGEHPGRDRIPRESAAMGACVITNRRGSAANDIDVPLDSWYKVDDSTPGFFEKEAAKKILEVMADYRAHQPRFEQWRKQISVERDGFYRDVDMNYAVV